ncbi:uncharacterized protein PpBr36_10655 [Pyricularia pennisetigena]|uniref:uncharacterized protein n=1 Tax=Pyricularia pennisetigena TaxID=1578925 RepID=UPI00115477F7|nr:uncharacterized protein PpBr36_10655 [Pyricularia pennisetigena]TLS21185.1 hypothetical protein PpBr36_10655 [Pyricularia pennisetigena]
MQQDQHLQKIIKWLAPPDVSTNDNKALEQRYGNTGQWFLRSEEYSQWKATSKYSLWLHGIPGCGKTILSSIIIDDLRHARSYSDNLLYFYFDFSDTSKQSLENAIRSLVYQLYQKNPSTYQGYLHSLYSSCENGSRMPTINLLHETLEEMAQQIGELWIVLDALDECQTRKGAKNEGLLSWMKGLLKVSRANIHFLFTSRPERDIKSALNEFVDRQIPIQSELVAKDICAYVHGRVRHYEGLKRWRKREDIQQEIENNLVQKANGMFRWVSCPLDSLEKCPDPISLREALKKLPRTLDETYARILSKIPPDYERNATRLLQFLTFSERPLQVEEAVDINAVNLKEKPRFNADYRMPEPDEISIYCSSLVVVMSKTDEDGNIKRELQLAHFSVKEYLISDRLESNMSLHFEERLARQCMAEICLAYLLDLSHDPTVVKLQKDWPLAEYAAQYWMGHAAQPGPNANGLRNLVWKFVQSERSHQICFGLYNPDKPWHKADLNSSEGVEAPLLYYMALGNVLCAVEKILNDGADVNAQGGFYGNALQIASLGGHKEIVQILVDNGANINA